MADKPKFAMYWAAACGGCDIALLGINEKILDFAEAFEPVFWPCVMDGKKSDIEGLADGALALTFFNGAIRTEEDEAMARLLRKKSAVFVAFGSCAVEGCMPGLSNLSSADDHLITVYLDNPSTTVTDPAVVPRLSTRVAEGELRLPGLYDTVRSVRQTVDIDYMIPGCPPEAHQLEAVMELFMGTSGLPEKGAVLGAGTRALCEECPRIRSWTGREQRRLRFRRLYEIIPDSTRCLIDQGIVCMGPATRGGCTALCPGANMPCIGCYGAPAGVADQGAAMLSALASITDAGSAGQPEEAMQREVEAAFEPIVDPVGTFYKFSLAHALLNRARPASPVTDEAADRKGKGRA
ncbi:MAG: oxidoreductase [Nitrospirota bacterium]